MDIKDIHLIKALKLFVARYPGYAKWRVAHDQCFEASVELQEVLFECGLIKESGRETYWDVVEVSKTPWMDLVQWQHLYKTHWVFRLDNLIIDPTARQFDYMTDFPAVASVADCVQFCSVSKFNYLLNPV